MSAGDGKAFAVSDNGSFFGTFGGGAVAGTWRWTAQIGWSKLSNSEADEIQTDQAGNMYGVYKTPYIAANQVGTWRWRIDGSWQRLSTVVPLELSVSNI